MEDNGLRFEHTRSLGSGLVGAHGRIFRGDMADAGHRNLGRKATSLGFAICEGLEPHGVGDAAILEGDLTDGVTGLRPSLNGSSSRIERYVEPQFDGTDDFRYVASYQTLSEVSTAHSPAVRAIG